MALNKYMHERNIYKHKKPDFQTLAVKYDYFREKVTQAVSGKVILDFKDPAALRALTRALLEEDFGLSVDLPLDRLIPMVPQRLNYILWLEDILGKGQQIQGIDIGTGASCIFPLLGCCQNGWKFLASDVDDQNVFFAQKNVEKNNMQQKITIKKVSEDTILQGLVEDEVTYDFCMCNPPFYTDHLEAQGITSSRSPDRPEPSSMSTASEKESIAWGGEVRFVCRMIEESLVLKNKIRVYTSMLGKKASVSLLKDELLKKKIPKFSTTEFCQGKTMRWGIAWTFDETVSFPKSTFKAKKNVKPPLVFEVPRTAKAVSDYTVQAYTHFIKQELDQLKIHFFVKHSGKFYTGLLLKATEDNWSHQRRKRRRRQRNSASESSGQDAEKQTDGNSGDASATNNGLKQTDTDPNTSDTKPEVTNTSSNTDNRVKQTDTDLSISETKPEGTNTSSNTDKESKNISENTVHRKDRIQEISGEEGTKCDISGSSSDKVESNKRTAEVTSDEEREDSCKRVKLVGDTAEPPVDLEAAWIQVSQVSPAERVSSGDHTGNHTEEPVLSRAEVVKQFWQEQETSCVKTGAPKSQYQSQEPFGENEDCIMQCKLELRKEEGIIRLVMTYLHGSKEAMAQIQQYFKNKITSAKGEYGAT